MTASVPPQDYTLPPFYKMKNFSYDVPFEVPGFLNSHPPSEIRCLLPEQASTSELFHGFVGKLSEAISDRAPLPILRLSDGEFEFLFGRIWQNKRETFFAQCVSFLLHLRQRFKDGGGINAKTFGIYNSGKYSFDEISEFRPLFLESICDVAANGYLALHLNYLKKPFHEQYFPSVDLLCDQLGIRFDNNNTIPFYFVYSLLASEVSKDLFEGRHVCLVHSARGSDRVLIEASLKRLYHVSKVSWIPISHERSFFDNLDIGSVRDVDIYFVGGGIGKSNLFTQLKHVRVPIIDAGFFFEVWKDSNNRFHRVFCANDNEWRERLVKSVFTHGI